MAWLGTWAKRVKLTIDHDDIDAEQTWHHLRVHLSASSGHSSRDVSCVFDELESNDNRKKIALTKADGTTQLYVEIEKWDHASEQAELWVSRDGWVWSPDVDTDLYLYYDKAKADNTTYVGDKGLAGRDGPRENVWDTGFKMVQHANDETTSTITDSTGNNNDGTKKGAGEPAVTTVGKIDDAQDFDGVDDRVAIADPVFNSDFFTISAWVYERSYSGNQGHGIFYQGTGASDYGTHLILYYGFTSGGIVFRVKGSGIVDPGPFFNLDEWVHIVAVNDNRSLKVYVNGVEVLTGSTVFSPVSNPCSIGVWHNYADSSRFFDGIIDEVRISDIARTAAWEKASHESERDHLLDFGEEELGVFIVEGTALGSGIGLSEVTGVLVKLGSASGSGIGLAEALGERILIGQAEASGIGTASVEGTVWFCKSTRIGHSHLAPSRLVPAPLVPSRSIPSRLDIVRLKSSRLPLCRQTRRS